MIGKMDISLQNITPSDLTQGDPKELDQIMAEIVAANKDNALEMADLTLAGAAALSAARGRVTALKEQKGVLRLWNNLVGKNEKLNAAIAGGVIEAQYAAQQMLRYVMQECSGNRDLILAVNDSINKKLLDMAENQLEAGQDISQLRGAVVGLFHDYTGKFDKMAAALEERCTSCGAVLESEQYICPKCGAIHSLKARDLSDSAMDKLRQLAAVMQKEAPSVQTIWDETARGYEKSMLQALNILKSQDLTIKESLEKDIHNLIDKCRNAEFQIAIVGGVKAGKSMLMNALIGEEIASVGVNSETAALTKFRSCPKGYYVQVKFYSEDGWKELKKSAEEARDHDHEGSLWSRISTPETEKETLKWVGHDPFKMRFEQLNSMKNELRRWTSAQSNDHLFAEEVEVGIDQTMFHMPPEVVFVDTPGLHDPVQYRSQITENYIQRADAVLVAVFLKGMDTEAFETITKVLDQAGRKKDKVYIIGTQRDKENTPNVTPTLIESPGGWVDLLVKARRYDSSRDAKARIILTAAYPELLLNKALRLSPNELDDDEYKYLNGVVGKYVPGRMISLENVIRSEQQMETVRVVFAVETLRKRLDKELICTAREVLLKDLAEKYNRCRQELLSLSKEAVRSQQELLTASRMGNETLQEKMNQAETGKAALDQEVEETDKALTALGAFVEKYIHESLSNMLSIAANQGYDGIDIVSRGETIGRIRKGIRYLLKTDSKEGGQ